ncbi:hypothetical protein OG250_42140 [Streptomyces sp. NBC_00487]|uniref:MmyB family transcriptional regulator n=1 Tax=unclassified Streptomyces TaxID=2593676 RepID=UPI002E17BEDE|nr:MULTISPECIES: hypothetical protein [unclassified Streptomyces]
MLTEPTEPLLATNHLARALYAPLLADPRRPANAARFIYLDPAARDFFPDWDSTADGIAAMLRAEAGRNPYDKDLSDLIGQLSTRSEIFRKRWADHKVRRRHSAGAKKLHHPVVGDLELHFETMTLTSDPRPHPRHLHRHPQHPQRRRPPPPRHLGRHPKPARPRPPRPSPLTSRSGIVKRTVQRNRASTSGTRSSSCGRLAGR